MNMPHNIYIHVPFCRSKCNYCAFFSHACANPDWGEYRRAIISEINHWADTLGPVDVPTIFFGGGTPSLMPSGCFTAIMDCITQRFNVPHDCEVTLESNPGTLDAAKLGEFISAGVRRLSVGVQSLDDKKLQFLGRTHSATDARRLLNSATQRGIRVSADFIYGIPGDTVDDVINMCNQINDLGLRHCSLYELTIEAGTPFARMNLNMPDNTEMADMYNAITANLNLAWYEVSNYAAIGDECRHNQNVWDGAPYIGIGRGAAGRIFLDGTWYEQMGAGTQFTEMSTTARATEKIITGMRTIRGVARTPDVNDIIDTHYIGAHPDLITLTPDRIAPTQKGMLILDDLLVNLVK